MNEYKAFLPSMQAALDATEEGDGCAVCIELEALLQTRRSLGAAATPPPFDQTAVEAHVSLLHDLAAGLDGVLILAAFEEGGTPNVQRFRIGDAAGMVETIMGFDGHPRVNLYTPWAVMRRDLEPCKKGTEADVVAVLAAVPDLDNDKYTIGELPFEAPYIVESSPGNFQPVYIFERALPPGEAKPVLAAVCDLIGGDSGTKDCSHVWRIPGTLNFPTKSKLARGRSPVPASVSIKKQYDGGFVSPAALLALAPPPQRPNGHDTTPAGHLSFAEEARLRDALAVIPADDRDIWLKAGAALHLRGARAVWDDWSRSSPKFDQKGQDHAWDSFHAERKEGFVTTATIFALAKERGWKPRLEAQQGEQKPARIIKFTPYVWQDPATLPMRRWLYGKHYIRRFLSATMAAGGLGKSSLDLVEAVAMASMINLLDVPVPERLRVAYCGEDPADEIDRRVGAILKHFKISREKIEGWLFVDSFRNQPLRIASLEKGEIVFPDADALTKALTESRIDVLILDPFVKTHGVSENDNAAIDLTARKFNDIAEAADCSIELAHHVRKASNFGRAEVTADDGRAAGALKDAARCVRVMNRMATAEAPAAQVKEKDRKRYFRVDDDAKANMTAPAEVATWFRLVSVPLYNDVAHPGANGDEVGVATSWQLPGVFAGLSTHDLPRVQAAIERDGPWARDVQSSDWAGIAIAQTLDLDLADEVAKERVKRMLAAWIASGALKVVTRAHPKRANRKQEIVIVGKRIEEEFFDET